MNSFALKGLLGFPPSGYEISGLSSDLGSFNTAFAATFVTRERSGDHRLLVRQSDGLVLRRACSFRQLAEKLFAYANVSKLPTTADWVAAAICSPQTQSDSSGGQ